MTTCDAFRESQGLQTARWMLVVISIISATGCSIYNAPAQQGKQIYFSHSAVDSSRSLGTKDSGLKRPSTGYLQLDLHFETDKSTLRQEDLERLQSFLLNFDADTATRFLLTGHTDSVHSTAYNTGLSERRAIATQKAMLNMGISKARTTLRARGESMPVASNSTAQGRQSNRRVSIEALQ